MRKFKARHYPATELLRMFRPETEDTIIAQVLGIHPKLLGNGNIKTHK